MSIKQRFIWAIVTAILVGALLAVLTSCKTTKPFNIKEIRTPAGAELPMKWTEESGKIVGILAMNWFNDGHIAIQMQNNKSMVSAWFWCWLLFTLLLCGFTEFVVYIPKVGWLFKLIGKRWSSLAGAILGWLFIRYILGGGVIFTSCVTALALVSANIGWEIFINWWQVHVKTANIADKVIARFKRKN